MRSIISSFAVSILLCSLARAGDYPIQPVSFKDVQVAGDFWQPRFRTNQEVTVWYDFKKCEETGRIRNFAIAGGLEEGDFEGIFFNDSDVFKVIEGASYSLTTHPDPKLDKYLDDLIAKIAAAQEDDGYLYSIRTIRGDGAKGIPGKTRWSNLRTGHELYNVGHMYESAVAHFEATGKRSLLDVAIKNADLVDKVFGPKEGQRIDVPGHEEIEIGLAKLYRCTGEQRYLDLAKFFLDMRGRSDKRQIYGHYCQDHKPVVDQEEAVGHAVRAGYLYAGMADVAALTGNQDYRTAIDRIWENIVGKKMYLTGGIGATRHGEAFGGNYELPNASAYNETCAAIANALLNHRLFLLHGDAKYLDVLERVIYNGFLSGISMNGDRFFYPNPLAHKGAGGFGRSAWFGCSCCPVNVVRFIPSIAGYVYATRDESLYVNLYVGGKAAVKVAGQDVEITQTTDYPWSGKIALQVKPQKDTRFTLRMRVPGWARDAMVPGTLYRYLDRKYEPGPVTVNGKPATSLLDRGFATIDRTWQAQGDTVTIEFPMPVRRALTDRQVEANRNRVALERGPVVYCFEGMDNDGHIEDVLIDDKAPVKPVRDETLLGGVTRLVVDAVRCERGKDGQVVQQPFTATAIPYYAWAHRKPGPMAVWMPRKQEAVYIPPPPTVASEARASASHVHGGDSTKALNDRREPKSSIDHDIPRHTWWDHLGTREWVQYDFKSPETVNRVSVYWFDDTGRGQCRVPASWTLLYRDGNAWKDVQDVSDYGIQRDRFNVTTFIPVKTSALRLQVQLQKGYSGGLLEWKLNQD